MLRDMPNKKKADGVRRERDEAITVLERLHIMSIVPEPPVPRAYALSPAFALSLKQALTGSGHQKSFGVPCDAPAVERMTIEDLDNHARGQWEAMLFYIVGSTGVGLNAGLPVTNGARSLLEMGHFVVVRGTRAAITREGFTFLLQDANIQVWSLLIVYLENAERLRMDPVEILSFLFMLGSLELGQAYSTKVLTPTQLQMLDDLSDYGLVYRKNSQSSYFYPTRLATTLTSDAGALLPESEPDGSAGRVVRPSQAQTNQGYIILETNHRVYAYTSSLLQVAILNLFVALKIRLPNLVTGKLTKESVQRAISSGITSDQIVSYLATHAHPQMHKTTPVLPPTVVDQIRLWQIEGDRMKATPGFLLKQFASTAEYDDHWRYAESLGVLVWKSDAKRAFFVTRIEQLQNYIRNRLQRAAAAAAAGDKSSAG